MLIAIIWQLCGNIFNNTHASCTYSRNVRTMGYLDSTIYYLCDLDLPLHLKLLIYKMGIMRSLLS